MRSLEDNEKTIAPDEVLLRRIPNFPDYTVFDHELGRERPSSAAFKLRSGESGLSLDRLTILLARSETALFSLHEHPQFGLAKLLHSDFTSNEFTVKPDPIDGNPAHSLAIGDFSRKKLKELASRCLWEKKPDKTAR